MKELPTILDKYDDRGLFLEQQFSDQGAPDVIKIAVDLSSANNLHADDYALVVDTPHGKAHKFPVIDAGNTISSALYFSEYGGSLPEDLQKEAAKKLSEALVQFGFTPPEDLTKVASMELGYGDASEDSSLERLFGVSEDSQWESISDAFSSCSPRGKRRLMLQVKEAGAFDSLLTEGMEDYARTELGSDFAVGIDTRKLVVLDAEGTTELGELMTKSASSKPDSLVEDLADFDIRHGITHLYGKIISDPYQTVFGTSVEKNASVSETLEIGGREYAPGDIVSWVEGGGSSSLTDSFGEEFSNEFASDPVAVLGSLPATHKQAIARMIDDQTI